MFNFIRRIRTKIRWKRHLKVLRKLPPREWAKEVRRLFPNSESPFMELTKRLNTPGAIVPDPEFKMTELTEEDAEIIEFQKKTREYHTNRFLKYDVERLIKKSKIPFDFKLRIFRRDMFKEK